ncbi:hypothetical protein DH2020_034074 [Rehmannia glutinosa]|uniref:Photolyase/cryptochrome alpha/beta domain-containing protein n=1 Tax=Rehmannia glutinosa TaxID=99300 RepID=A0ABR0VDJ6_REHGL
MALLLHPRLFSVSIHRKQAFPAPKAPLRFSVSAVDMRAESGGAGNNGTAILWYKHDLRIEDHPGLVAASQHRCVDLVRTGFSDEMLELLLFALEDLRKLLKEKGSNLMIRFGRAENVIGELVKEVQASSIFVEEEVDLKDLPSSFDDFKKLKLPVVSSVVSPELPGNVMNLSWGTLPTLADVKEYMDDISDGGNKKKEWTSINKFSAENLLQRKKLKRNLDLKPADLKEEQGSGSKTTQRKKSEKSVFVTSQGSLVGGGSSRVLNALAAYLRYLEGTARDEWQERRVYLEAIKYEKERNGGFLLPFGYSTTTVAAAINTVSSMEWYWLLTLKGQRNEAGNFSIRIWRWNNYLIQYTVAGHEGPAILLVHGFGAFLEHYRDNVYPIAEAGNRVWAITLLGFGKSEKPNIIYTELVWAELLRDFIIEVVGEPVHLVGNSIGGYSVAIAAGLWSSLAKSVVLMNSAGNIIPEYSAFGYSKDRRSSGAARLGARLLLLYLRFNIRNILKNFYPTKTDRADDRLINEMIRAGMKDPLSDSKSMLAMFREHLRGIAIKEIDAGHCPHDEVPNEVNSIIKEWVVTLESQMSPVASKQLQ